MNTNHKWHNFIFWVLCKQAYNQNWGLVSAVQSISPLSASICYKKCYILSGGFIRGPNKPWNADSYIRIGLSHLGAIQKGLKIWDVSHQVIFVSQPFLTAIGADAVGLALIAGMVGHNGKHSCWVHCPFVGWHKACSTHYYGAWLKPTNFTVAECNHDSVDLDNILTAHTSATSKAWYGNDIGLPSGILQSGNLTDKVWQVPHHTSQAHLTDPHAT